MQPNPNREPHASELPHVPISGASRNLALGNRLAETLTPVLLSAHVLAANPLAQDPEVAAAVRMIRRHAEEARLLLDDLRRGLTASGP